MTNRPFKDVRQAEVKGGTHMDIESYRFGHIVINGQAYSKDLKIIDGVIYPGWWRNEGHLVTLDDVADVISAGPHTLIVGTGASGRLRIARGLAEKLGEYGVRLEAVPTELAVARFLELIEMVGLEDVAGAFHLTC